MHAWFEGGVENYDRGRPDAGAEVLLDVEVVSRGSGGDAVRAVMRFGW